MQSNRSPEPFLIALLLTISLLPFSSLSSSPSPSLPSPSPPRRTPPSLMAPMTPAISSSSTVAPPALTTTLMAGNGSVTQAPTSSPESCSSPVSSPALALAWERHKRIVAGIAAALFYIHEQLDTQIIHLDVKTSNVMLDFGYNARLGDFGLDRWLKPQMAFGLSARSISVNNKAPIRDGGDRPDHGTVDYYRRTSRNEEWRRPSRMFSASVLWFSR
ncbi:hypothetical protein J5N97_016331 [Dioscorea zingiberensis]|uniref:Protein kinase domain-containing protein n=1 Tax=Dioscorea zingiberensis TaxID=325984 RepID=A0A9D5CJE0_9LILI|nr:hypothetical protein J5N97_016331 [Dioscorea zingiberensis]